MRDRDDLRALDDAALVARVATEIEGYTPRALELVLRPQSAFQLAALLQLALRHPAVTTDLARTGRMAIEHIRAYFEFSPALQEMLRRGDDPAYDRERP